MFERQITFDEARGCYLFSYPPPEESEKIGELSGVFSASSFWPGSKISVDFSRTEKPAALAQIPDGRFFSEGPDIERSTAVSIDIKSKRDHVLRLPRCLSFCASATLIALDNFYSEFGAEVFYKSELTTTISRGNVKPNSQLRPEFGHWHDHRNEDLDVIYSCSDTLPTEFKVWSKVLTAPILSVCRFNKETYHKSPTNTETFDIHRTWWSLQTRLAPKLKNRPDERTLLSDFGLPENYRDISDQLIAVHGNHVRNEPETAIL